MLVLMSSNLCLSCLQQTQQILGRKLLFVNRDKVPRGLFTSRNVNFYCSLKKSSYLFIKYIIILENALFGDFFHAGFLLSCCLASSLGDGGRFFPIGH